MFLGKKCGRKKHTERAACQAAFFHENGNESDNRTRELFYLGNIIISWKRKKNLTHVGHNKVDGYYMATVGMYCYEEGFTWQCIILLGE